VPTSTVHHHIHESPSSKTADGDRDHEVKKLVDGTKAFLGMKTGFKGIPEN